MRFKPRVTNLFGTDPWILIDDFFSLDNIWHKEAVFAQGNGFIGMRGTLDEPVSDNPWKSMYACFLNGSYEYEDILYTWRRHGLAEKTQIMLRIPDWHLVDLEVDGRLFRMTEGVVNKTCRKLDFRTGTLRRKVEWTAPEGGRFLIETERFISMPRKHTACQRYKVTSLDGVAQVKLSTSLDGTVQNLFSGKPHLFIQQIRGDQESQYLELRTKRSGQTVGMACASRCSLGAGTTTVEGTKTATVYRGLLPKGQTATLDKIIRIHLAEGETSRLYAEVRTGNNTDAAAGYETLLKEHEKFWAEFWRDADIEIRGDDPIQQGVRFAMFQLAQNAGRDGRTNIGAKGLTGYNYSGKTFWDTEVYMIPFFVNCRPEWARALLDFRYLTLDKARENAKLMPLSGALFPWETINGEECSFIYEAGTAQYHINCAVGYAIRRYYDATGDWGYMADKGLEILVETSRCLFDVGHFSPFRGGKFCMAEVCGPDEYSPMVDNNCYTNVMTKHNFLFTLMMLDKLKGENPSLYREFFGRLGLDEAETENWRKAADNMYVPYSEELGIHLQDDQYLYRKPVDLEQWLQSEERKAHHPLNLFRLQISKQADVVLLMILRGLDFDREQKRRNYEFYEPRTLHDSSLSPCMYSIVAQEIGKEEHALPYLFYTVRLDLDDYGGAGDGLHAASLGGVWQGIVQGIAGVVMQDEKLEINPRLPAHWKLLRFKYRFAGSWFEIQITPGLLQLKLIAGEGFAFKLGAKQIRLHKETPVLKIKIN
ncbi:MAG: glycoside hydrolase family 65 protein [Bacillota bacterium]